MLILIRAHGWDRNLDNAAKNKLRKKNKINKFYSKYTFYDLAYNARPTEINGFIGNLQINYWDEIVKIRANNFTLFQTIINNNPDFYPLVLSHMGLISNFAVPVICKTKKIFEKYKNKFTQSEVEIRPIIAGNITKQPFYKKYIKEKNSCKNSDLIHANGFYFGNNPELTKNEIKIICALLKK
jgi:CDP-6-deoxy-D-xylo-4-hexulose-3-dehydrase